MRIETAAGRRQLAAQADQRVFLRGVSWRDFENILAAKGDSSAVRVAYLDGVLELMSPAIPHEFIKTMLARLLETASMVLGFPFEGYGSWTLKEERKRSGIEPDECYFVTEVQPDTISRWPDMAIEVVWTHGGLDRLEIYRRLGVREVWVWEDGAIHIYKLKADRYARARKSSLLPQIDLALLVEHVELGWTASQTKAVRAYARALAKRRVH